MVINTNYTFYTSISVDSYFNKEICTAAIAGTREERKDLGLKLKIGFKEEKVTPQILLDKCLTGHTFCNLFNGYTNTYNQTLIRKTDNAFTMSAKCDNYFNGSYTVSVDIDEITNYTNAADFISALSKQPTFWNSTYNHLQANKGIRIRLVYVFDELIKGNDYGWFYRYVSSNVVNQIIKDTNESIDNCSLKASQYFNGTNINNTGLNVEYGISNIIYSFSDFDINDYNFYSFLLNDNTVVKKDKKNKKDEYIRIYTTYYNDLQKSATPTNEEKEHLNTVISVDAENNKVSESLLSDMTRLDYDEFMKWNRHKYNYFYRVDNYNWIDAGAFKWAFIDKEYFSLYWNVNTVKDGSKRRKKIFERMCLRRVINPNVDADTLAFNTYEDIHRFFDNSDGILNSDFIERNIEYCFTLTIEQIKELYSENIEYLKTKAPKKGKIYSFKQVAVKDRNTFISQIEMTEIMSYYNSDLTIKENLQYLSNWGFNVCEKTLYNYLNKLGLSNKQSIDKKREEKELYIKSLINDDNCSNRKFRETLNELNIKLSDKKLREYIKEYKEGKEEVRNQTTYYNDLQQTATPSYTDYDYTNSVFSTDCVNSEENTSLSLDYQELETEGLNQFNLYYTNYNKYYY